MNHTETLAQWLQESNYTVVLTGAGMSTESGVPDFRSADQGLWTKYDPFTVSHIRTVRTDYDAFHDFYSFRIQEMNKVRPNRGHEILAGWQEQGLVHFLATQNVENLHQRAGSSDVAQLHGGLEHIHCERCASPFSQDAFLNKEACVVCDGKLRPGIVLFGEMLPQDVWNKTFLEVSRSDLLVVIGTSLHVSPVNQLPQTAGGKVAIINLDDTPFDEQFDLVIRGKAGDVLKKVQERMIAAT